MEETEDYEHKDVTLQWLQTAFSIQEGSCVLKAAVYSDYRNFCKRNGLKPTSPPAFGRLVHRAFPDVKSRRRGPRGLAKHVYGNVGPSESYINEKKRTTPNEELIAQVVKTETKKKKKLKEPPRQPTKRGRPKKIQTTKKQRSDCKKQCVRSTRKSSSSTPPVEIKHEVKEEEMANLENLQDTLASEEEEEEAKSEHIELNELKQMISNFYRAADQNPSVLNYSCPPTPESECNINQQQKRFILSEFFSSILHSGGIPWYKVNSSPEWSLCSSLSSDGLSSFDGYQMTPLMTDPFEDFPMSSS